MLLVTGIYGILLFPQSDVSQDVITIFSLVSERVYSSVDQFDESGHWRTVIWSESWQSLYESHFLGIGLGQGMYVEIGGYRDFVEVRNIHNSLLALLLQMGVIGFMVFGTYVFLALQYSWRVFFSPHEEGIITRTLYALVLFQCIAFLFQPYLETNLLSVFFWITIGVLFSWGRIVRKSI
jgi:O-antigen ligase